MSAGAEVNRCWCGWQIHRPRFLFASHIDWHLDHCRRLRWLDEVLAK